jgi:hypothetical protein
MEAPSRAIMVVSAVGQGGRVGTDGIGFVDDRRYNLLGIQMDALPPTFYRKLLEDQTPPNNSSASVYKVYEDFFNPVVTFLVSQAPAIQVPDTCLSFNDIRFSLGRSLCRYEDVA